MCPTRARLPATGNPRQTDGHEVHGRTVDRRDKPARTLDRVIAGISPGVACFSWPVARYATSSGPSILGLTTSRPAHLFVHSVSKPASASTRLLNEPR